MAKRVSVSVKPSAKEARIVALDAKCFLVAVREPAENGKANKGVRKAIALYFGVTTSSVRIKSGHASRRKIVEID